MGLAGNLKKIPHFLTHTRDGERLLRVRCTAGFGVNPECIELAVTRG